jgi:hypothetical protein
MSVKLFRIFALAVMAVGETLTLIHLYPRKNFVDCLFFSLLILSAAISLLFERWEPLRGIPGIRGTGIIICIVLCPMALRYWLAGDLFSAILLAAFPVFGALNDIATLIRPPIWPESPEEMPPDWKLPLRHVVGYFAALSYLALALVVVAARSWLLALSTLWSLFSGILALFFVFALVVAIRFAPEFRKPYAVKSPAASGPTPQGTRP